MSWVTIQSGVIVLGKGTATRLDMGGLWGHGWLAPDPMPIPYRPSSAC